MASPLTHYNRFEFRDKFTTKLHFVLIFCNLRDSRPLHGVSDRCFRAVFDAVFAAPPSESSHVHVKRSLFADSSFWPPPAAAGTACPAQLRKSWLY